MTNGPGQDQQYLWYFLKFAMNKIEADKQKMVHNCLNILLFCGFNEICQVEKAKRALICTGNKRLGEANPSLNSSYRTSGVGKG